MIVLVYILLCLIWGSTWIAIKLGLNDAPPFYSVSFRYMLAIVILLLLILTKRLPFPKTISSFLRLGSPGLLMYSSAYASVYIAEQYISSSLAAVLISTIPFFIAIGNISLLPLEKLKRSTWFVLMIGFVGVFFISYTSYEQSLNLFFGSLLMLLAAAISAFGTIFQKRYFNDQPILTSVTVQMIVGGIPLFLLAVFTERWDAIAFTDTFILSFIYLALFGSVIAFLGYYWLLKKVPTITLSLISFITPVVALFIGVGLFNESFSGMTILGTVLILSGVLGVIANQKKAPIKS